jgi:amino acid transporter
MILQGALCYIELGIIISESGAEFIYILRGFSTVNQQIARLLAFIFSWSAAVIIKPTSFAAISLACSSYILGNEALKTFCSCNNKQKKTF